VHEKTLKREKKPKNENSRNLRDWPIHVERILQGYQTNHIQQSYRKKKSNAQEDQGWSRKKSGNQATGYFLHHKIRQQVQDRYQKLNQLSRNKIWSCPRSKKETIPW
jgi:hypothetical protein